MRKVFSVLLVIALVAALAAPAKAAELYLFEWWEPVVLPDFVDDPRSLPMFFYYEGFVPDGLYNLTLFDVDGSIYYSSDSPVLLTFAYSDLSEGDVVVVSASGYFAVDNRADLVSVDFQVLTGHSDGEVMSFVTVVLEGPDREYRNFGHDYGCMVRLSPVADSTFDVASSFFAVGSVVDATFGVLMSNWYLVALLCLSLLGVGVAALRRLKRAR